MRRPAAFLFSAFAGGIFTGYYLPFPMAASLCGMLFLAALLLEKQHICVFLLIGMLGICYLQATDSRAEPLDAYDGRILTVEGKVLTIEDRETYLRILIRPKTWKCGEASGTTSSKLIVNLSYPPGEEYEDPDILLKDKMDLFGKEVRLSGRFTLPSGMRNPGLFDYKLYLKTRGISGIVNANKVHLEIIGSGSGIRAALGKLKASYSASLDEYLNCDSKALMLGILFGDKTRIDEEVYEDFQRNGCAHILSVSGIHVSIIYIYITRLFRNRRNPAGCACVLVFLFFYAALADFSDTVVRAVLMIIIHILSSYVHRRYDLLCCISFSAFLMLLYNPFYLFGLGFQLSYLAVFTLAFALPVTESKIKKLTESGKHERLAIVLRVFAPIFVIQAGMTPVSAYHFQYFSFSAFFINLPVIFLSEIILPLGMVMLSLNFISADLFGFSATGADLLIQAMIRLNSIAGDVSISSVNVTGPSAGILMLYYGLFFFFTSESFWILYQKRNKRRIIAVLACILCVSAAVPFMMGESEREADIIFLDVGQGDCIHLRTPSGKNILIDGGGNRDYDIGKRILRPYLLKNGAGEVDMAIVTHLHQDHYGGIASLCGLMPVRKLAVYRANALIEETILADTGLTEEALVYLAAGDRIHIEEGIYIDVLYPLPKDHESYRRMISDREDENNCCLVLRVFYKGISLLVTGDLGIEGENQLMENCKGSERASLRSDLLKVGHHGSRFSTGDDFLAAVDPQIAVIQVGKNNFGHPSPDVIEKLTEKGIIVCRNDRNGAILLDVDKRGVRLRTML